MEIVRKDILAERRRLIEPPHPNQPIDGMGVIRFNVNGHGNIDLMLTKVKEVLLIVSRYSIDSNWPTELEWRAILPAWFVNSCAPPMSDAEAQKWLQWWRGLSARDQELAEINNKWNLANWLYWMEPTNRQWFWWAARPTSNHDLIIAVEVRDWPFPWGALRWLFITSGAHDVVPEK
ncbi:MAG: hypothetical protein ABIF71_14780 [Planctomycetota bacterium]